MAAKMPGGRTKATPKKAAGPVKRSGAKASTSTGGTATATKRKTKAKTNAARKSATRRGD